MVWHTHSMHACTTDGIWNSVTSLASVERSCSPPAHAHAASHSIPSNLQLTCRALIRTGQPGPVLRLSCIGEADLDSKMTVRPAVIRNSQYRHLPVSTVVGPTPSEVRCMMLDGRSSLRLNFEEARQNGMQQIWLELSTGKKQGSGESSQAHTHPGRLGHWRAGPARFPSIRQRIGKTGKAFLRYDMRRRLGSSVRRFPTPSRPHRHSLRVTMGRPAASPRIPTCPHRLTDALTRIDARGRYCAARERRPEGRLVLDATVRRSLYRDWHHLYMSIYV